MQDLVRNGYVLTADPKRVDFGRVHRWLAEESYWAAGRPYDLVARSIAGSLPYSVFTTDSPLAGTTLEGGPAASTGGSPHPAIASPSADSPLPAGPSGTNGPTRPPGSSDTNGPIRPIGPPETNGPTRAPGSSETTNGPTRPIGSSETNGSPGPTGLSDVGGSFRLGGPQEAGGEQVAFARAVTDGATFAWICDVFVAQDHRGRGLGKWMIDTILADLSERGIQRFLLATRDAQEVYRRSGFSELEGAHRFMEIDRRPTRNAILGRS